MSALHDTRPRPPAAAPLRLLLLERKPSHHPDGAAAPAPAPAAGGDAAAAAAESAPPPPPPPEGADPAPDGLGFIPRRDLGGLSAALSPGGPADVRVFPDERQLLGGFCEAVRRLDADVIVTWDVQRGGLGYLAERAAGMGINLLREASRTPEVGMIVMTRLIMENLNSRCRGAADAGAGTLRSMRPLLE
jgi:hypothetical protein